MKVITIQRHQQYENSNTTDVTKHDKPIELAEIVDYIAEHKYHFTETLMNHAISKMENVDGSSKRISKDDVDKNETSYMRIDEEDRSFINYILDNYAGFSGTELEVMTHKEQPWIEARHGIGPMESCNEVISEDTMRDFYGKKWNEINS